MVYLLQSTRRTNTAPWAARSAQPPRCKRALAALHRCCHCPAPTAGGKTPNLSCLAGTSLGFVAVMNGPPRDSHGEVKAQLLPLLGGSGWVAFDRVSLGFGYPRICFQYRKRHGFLDGVSSFCCYSPLSSVTLSWCPGCCRSIGCSQMALHGVFKTSLLTLLGAGQCWVPQLTGSCVWK